MIARHNGVNLAWLIAEKAAGVTVQREQKVVFGEKKKPADTLVWGWKGEDACAQDWAVVHPLTKSNLKSKKLNPYAAVEKAEERKKRLEGEMCETAGVEFLPLAMDTFGGFGPSAAAALGVVADQLRTVKGEEEDHKEYRAKRIAQKLRIVMLRYVARQIISRSDVGRTEEIQEGEEEGWPVAQQVEEYVSDSEKEEGEYQKTDAIQRESQKSIHRCEAAEKGEQKPVSDRRKESCRRTKTGGHQKECGKPDVSTETRKTALGWTEWRKDRGLIGQEKWNLEWFREGGLEVVDAGQGRGGECQYLSALVMSNPEAWKVEAGRIVVQYKKVDGLRRSVADWMEKHKKEIVQSGLSLQDMTLAEWKGRGRNEEEKWRHYISGVRNGHSGQWGDDCTLMGLSGVLGRPIYALSCGKDKMVRQYDVSAPLSWGDKIEGAPLLLAHVSNLHYCPVKILEGGEWNFVLAPEEDRNHPDRRRTCKAVADERLVIRMPGKRAHECEDATPLTKIEGAEARGQKQGLRADTCPPERRPKRNAIARELSCGDGIRGKRDTTELRSKQERQGRKHFPPRLSGPMGTEEPATKNVGERSHTGVRHLPEARENNQGQQRASDSTLATENEMRRRQQSQGHDVCESKRDQDLQGRNYHYHCSQRPERPVSSKPALSCSHEEAKNKTKESRQEGEAIEHQNFQKGKPAEKADVFLPLMRKERGDSDQLDNGLAPKNEDGERRNQVLQRRIQSFDQRSGGLGTPEPTLPEETEQEGQCRSEGMEGMEGLEIAMTALQLGMTDAMEIEEEQRGNG